MNEDKRKTKFRLLIGLYWFMALIWGWCIVKLPTSWFLLGGVVSSILCGLGAKAIEKAHENIVNFAILEERSKHE